MQDGATSPLDEDLDQKSIFRSMGGMTLKSMAGPRFACLERENEAPIAVRLPVGGPALTSKKRKVLQFQPVLFE